MYLIEKIIKALKNLENHKVLLNDPVRPNEELGLSETSPQYHLQCLALPLTLKNLIWLALGQLLGIRVSAGFQYLAFTRVPVAQW